MKKRVYELVQALHMTPNGFSTSLGFCRSFAKCIGKSTSAEKVGKILSTYPQVNPYWLLLGQGEMFINQNEFTHHDYKELYDVTKKDNEMLRKENALLRNQLQEILLKNSEFISNIAGINLVHNGQ